MAGREEEGREEAVSRVISTPRSGHEIGDSAGSEASQLLPQLLCRESRVRPRFVQNRCYAVRGWDRRIREFCSAHEIVYQGFSLLTANREVLARPEMAQIAKRHDRTVSQIIFRFALDVGILPLTGTTDADHMRADFDVLDFHLEPNEVEQIEHLAVR